MDWTKFWSYVFLNGIGQGCLKGIMRQLVSDNYISKENGRRTEYLAAREDRNAKWPAFGSFNKSHVDFM